MQSIEHLKKAVETCTEYSPSQRKILSLFIDVAVDNIVNVPVKYIEDKTSIKKATIYFAINLFLKNGVIKRDTGASKAFILSNSKLEYLVANYNKKYNIEK